MSKVLTAASGDDQTYRAIVTDLRACHYRVAPQGSGLSAELLKAKGYLGVS